MPISSDRYVLPPPVGVGNDLYEPFPQKADTVFDTFNNRFPDITTNRISAAPVAAQGNYFQPLPDVSQYDYSYLGSNLNAATAGSSLGTGNMGNAVTDGATTSNAGIFGDVKGGIQGALTQGDKAIEGVLGLPSGTLSGTSSASMFSMDNIVKLFVRALVVILGFIFVAVGLTMLGAKTGVGSEVIREVRRNIPR